MMHGLPRRGRTTPDIVLLAPSAACVPPAFRDVDVNPAHHQRLLGQLQRLRGQIYLQDGAIEPSQLSTDGRHTLDVDEVSWHLISKGSDGRIMGCARYRPHSGDVKPEDLGVWASALARDRRWQHALRMAVEEEIESARRRKMDYVEVGGWAVAEEMRFSPEALDIALSTYALARNLGGCVGITTATMRHASSRILRKIGGRPLEHPAGPLPSYYDPQYRCEMELLRFDSNALNPRFEARIGDISSWFLNRPVVCAKSTTSSAANTSTRAGAMTSAPSRRQVIRIQATQGRQHGVDHHGHADARRGTRLSRAS